jgi:hypothetical protein
MDKKTEICKFRENQIVATKLKHVSAATDGHENNRGDVGDGDLYSVRPEVIKSGHAVVRTVCETTKQ